MADAIDRELVYEITVPANTTKEAPRKEPTQFNPGEVVSLEIVIPAGVAGLAGIRISSNGVQLFPINTGKWLSGDDDVIKRDVYNFPNSGRLEIEGYNEDSNAHTFIVRYGVREIALPRVVTQAGASPLMTTPTGQPLLPTTPLGTEGTPEELGQTAPPTSEPPTSLPPSPETLGSIPSPAPEPTKEPPATPPPPVPGEVPAPPEGPELPAPPSGELGTTGAPEAPPSAEVEPAGTEPAPRGGAPVTKGRKPATPGRTRTRTVTTRETLPAGGWLPKGARFTKERTDQGQDGITNWRGPIIAPGDGFVVRILRDKPFPSGFGPSYAVVKITSGRFAGRDWYIGHCTAAVRVNERFTIGHVLAHADQGLRDGGGWFEIGEAPSGYPGPMGRGAAYVNLFGPVTITHTHTVKEREPARKAVKPGATKPGAKQPAKRKLPGMIQTGGTPAPVARKPPEHKAPERKVPERSAPPSRTGGTSPAPRATAPPPPARKPAPPPPAPPPRKAPPPRPKRR